MSLQKSKVPSQSQQSNKHTIVSHISDLDGRVSRELYILHTGLPIDTPTVWVEYGDLIEKAHSTVADWATGRIDGQTYTLGIEAMLGKPEVFISSLVETKIAFVLTNTYNEFIKSGKEFELDVPYSDFLEGYDVVFKKVLKSNYEEYFGQAIEFYGDDNFEVWQMVLPDVNGLFPWDIGVDGRFKDPQNILFGGLK